VIAKKLVARARAHRIDTLPANLIWGARCFGVARTHWLD